MSHSGSFLFACLLMAFSAVILCDSAGFAEYVPDTKRLSKAAADFEAKHGICAAVLVESHDCRIVFIHNNELAVQRRFPPGSLMKPMSAAVLCENGLKPEMSCLCCGHFVPDCGFSSSDEKRFNLSRELKTGKKSFPCSLYSGHGRISLREALVRSCNVYFLNAAQSCPSFYEKLVAMWKMNDPLIPGLSAENPVPREVPPFQQLSAAIGEGPGVLVSALKVAENYSAFFEGTPLMEPHANGSPVVRAEISFREETLSVIRTALSGTIKNGTLSSLRIPEGCTVLAGKTGTSTDLKDKSIHHGWNVIWLERKEKRYLLVSFVLQGSGPKEAAALSSALLEAI